VVKWQIVSTIILTSAGEGSFVWGMLCIEVRASRLETSCISGGGNHGSASFRSSTWGVRVELLQRRECRVTKSAFVDSNPRRFESPAAGTSVSFRPDASAVEIHHGRALDLSFICHRTSANDCYLTASSWGARSPREAYAFAAAVTIIPVPAQLVHRILFPDDRSFTFPVPWHFLQLCEGVSGFSWTVHYRLMVFAGL
jgi:hypothetical protein